ncbi:MAG TPA: PaaI family thioesterase [Acidimicrobiia bacterium]|nr:PaaI family thioesterase [Acidimicrobiia bacterium]
MSDGPDRRAVADQSAMEEYLRTTFYEMPLHRLLGLRFVENEAGRVVVEMPVRQEAFNGSGNLHGGAIATLVDVAAGSCAARASGFDAVTQSLVTADIHVRYLGRPKGDVVRADARLVRAGRMLIVVEVRVLDPDDNVIAVADFSSMVVPRREPLREGTTSDPSAPDL